MAKFDKEFEEFEASLKGENDIFAEFEAEQEAANSAMVGENLYPETIEGKYLQPVYDVAEPVTKALSVFEKPLSSAMAVGKTIGRGLTELVGNTNEGHPYITQPIKDELNAGLFPAQENSLLSPLRELGIGTEPMLEGVVPQSIKAQFPKASSVVENIAPTDVGEMAASTALGMMVPGAAKNKRAAMIEGDKEIAKSALIRGSDRDVKFVSELRDSGKLDSLSRKVLENPTIRKALAKPEKMIEYLQGVVTEATDPVTGFRKKVPVVRGKLNEVGDSLHSAIRKFDNKVSGGHKMFLDTRRFTDEIADEIMAQSDLVGSGTAFDRAKIVAEIEKYTKAMQANSLNAINANRKSFGDLVQIKRGAADRIFEMKKAGLANVDNPTFAEYVAQKVWAKADDEIHKIADSFQDYDVIKMNNEFSDYQKIRELYANKDIVNKFIPSLMEDIVPASVIGTGAALLTGSPYTGVLAAGAYPMARSGASGLAKEFPAHALNTRMGAIEPALDVISKIKAPVTGAMMSTTKLPRDTQKLISMRDQVLSAVAKQTKTPDGKMLFDEMVRVYDEDPSQLQQMLPALMQNYPQIFEVDPYNRIDGTIYDPILKQKAMEDILHKKQSSYQSAQEMETLINRNKYFGN